MTYTNSALESLVENSILEEQRDYSKEDKFITKDSIAQIMGDVDILRILSMLSLLGGKVIKNYKNISSKDPEIVFRDILNSEALLSQRETDSRKVLKEAKKYFGNLEIIVLSVIRFSNPSLEDVAEIITAVLGEFQGGRIYIDSQRQIRQNICMHTAKMLNEKYDMTDKEIAVLIEKCPEQVRRYISKVRDNKDQTYLRLFAELAEIMDDQHKELLEKQGNKLFIRKKKNSKTYIVVDLDKKKGQKGREYTMREEEVEKYLKDYQKKRKKELKKNE